MGTIREAAERVTREHVEETMRWVKQAREREATTSQYPDIVIREGDRAVVSPFTHEPRVDVDAYVDATDWREFVRGAAEIARHYGCVVSPGNGLSKVKELDGGFSATARTAIGSGVLLVVVRPGRAEERRILRPPTCRTVKRIIPAHEIDEIVCETDADDEAEAGVAGAEEAARVAS